MLKTNDKNYEASKSIGIASCEDNNKSFTAKHCKKHAAKGIELIEKPHLMSCNVKANYLMYLFRKETITQHKLNKKNKSKIIKRISCNVSS